MPDIYRSGKQKSPTVVGPVRRKRVRLCLSDLLVAMLTEGQPDMLVNFLANPNRRNQLAKLRLRPRHVEKHVLGKDGSGDVDGVAAHGSTPLYHKDHSLTTDKSETRFTKAYV